MYNELAFHGPGAADGERDAVNGHEALLEDAGDCVAPDAQPQVVHALASLDRDDFGDGRDVAREQVAAHFVA